MCLSFYPLPQAWTKTASFIKKPPKKVIKQYYQKTSEKNWQKQTNKLLE
jgi:hypothetical protein